MLKLRTALLAAALSLAAFGANAQNNFVTPGGSTAAGAVQMCLNGSNQAVPCGASGTPTVVGGTGATNADAVANAATGAVPTETFNYVYNGTTWDRWRGDTTNGGFVQVKTTVAPLGITPTDRTIASTSGASQQVMAANAARHSLTIVNTGNANCGVNPTGGTAAIGAAGTLTLGPLGAYTPRVPTLSAVTVICTAAQPIYADEN